MDEALDTLAVALKTAKEQLKGPLREQLQQSLHQNSSNTLPDARIRSKVDRILNDLHDVQMQLQPAVVSLADQFFGYASSKCLVAACQMNIPDILEQSGPLKSDKLASLCGAHVVRLRQIMRLLVMDGIFEHDAVNDVFGSNHASKLLTTKSWAQWRHWVSLYDNEFYDMANGIPAACLKEATKSPGQIYHGTDDSMFQFFQQKQWLPKFYNTLNAGADAMAAGIVADYPWREIASAHVIDIGGGDGGLIALLLRNFPDMTGGVFERPAVVDLIKANFSDIGKFADVAMRVDEAHITGGDFFREVTSNNIYVMKWCLHDWNDDNALRILAAIRESIIPGPESRLVLLECMIEEGYAHRLGNYADMNMFIAVGGQERSEAQWRSLATRSGWDVSRIFKLRDAWPWAIELRPSLTPTTAAVNGTHTASNSSVSTKMTFLEPWDGSKGSPYFRSAPEEGYDKVNFTWVEHTVQVHDARPDKDTFQLDAHGFTYMTDPSGDLDDGLLDALRNNDRPTIERYYYPRVTELIKRATSATRVIIFDHTIRRRRPELAAHENKDGQEQPATIVHCDQSGKGAIRRLRQNLKEGEDADELLKTQCVQMINVWRPLKGPVVDWPLAQMAFPSLRMSDAWPCDLWRGAFEERGQTMTFCHNDAQKWYYLDGHRTDEVTMLKIWDSRDGIANTCAHAAFQHPDTPIDCEPRESVEVRCLLLHQK